MGLSAHAAGQTSEGKTSNSGELAGAISFIRSKNSEISSYSVESRVFTNKILVSKDVHYFKQPVYLRWEEYRPLSHELRSILTANGKDCLLYEPESKTLKKWSCKWKEFVLAAASPLFGFSSSGEEVRLAKNKQSRKNPMYVIEVTDRMGSSNRNLWTISRGYFDRKSGLLLKLDLLGGYGDIRSETVFDNYKLNIPLEDGLFVFTPPPDTKVIEGDSPY